MQLGLKNKIRPILISVVLLLISLVIVVLILSKDERSFDDNALRLLPIEVAERDNSFYDLSKAVEKLSLADEDWNNFDSMVRGKIWDNNLAGRILADNGESISYFNKAAGYLKFQVPSFQNVEMININSVVPAVGKWRTVAKMSSLSSLYLFKQGREKEAFDESLKIIKLGQLIANAPRPIFIQYLMGMAIQNIGIERLKTMVSSTSLASGDLKYYARELSNAQIAKEQGGVILKEEYTVVNNSLDFLKKEEQESLRSEFAVFKLLDNLPYYYKPNETKRLLFEYHLEQSKNFDKKYYNETNFPTFKKFLSPDSKIKKIFTENLIGKMIYDEGAMSFGHLFSATCKQDFFISGMQVLLALRAHKIEKGNLPVSLDALVPDYIPAVPDDPFDGRPIRFSNSKKIIYSVGEDLKEDTDVNNDLFLPIDF